MNESLTEAHPYAKAYFELLQANQAEIEASLQALKELAEIAQTEPKVRTLLLEPSLSASNKIAFLYKLVPALQEFTTLRKIISLLADKKRIAVVLSLGLALQKILHEHNNISKVEVLTPQKLDQSQLDAIKASLEKSLGQEVQLQEKIDESLIAGLVIQTEEFVLDNSLKGRLNKMSQNLAVAKG